MPYKTHEEVMRMHLSNPGVAAEYLIAALATEDAGEIRDALNSIMDAYNSKKSDGLGERLIEDLSRALAPTDKPIRTGRKTKLIHTTAPKARRIPAAKRSPAPKRTRKIAA